MSRYRRSFLAVGALATLALRELDSRALPPAPTIIDDSVSDGDLARAVAEGAGEAAEAALVARFRKRVFLYGMRHLRDESRANDLSQDVMVTVIERLRVGGVREPDRIGSFILGTARWMSRDACRRERRTTEVARAAAQHLDLAVPPIEPLDTERLADALGSLSERERAVVLLTFREDQSAREIGEAFGLKTGHVRVIRHRALARLGELLGVTELEQKEEAT